MLTGLVVFVDGSMLTDVVFVDGSMLIVDAELLLLTVLMLTELFFWW